MSKKPPTLYVPDDQLLSRRIGRGFSSFAAGGSRVMLEKCVVASIAGGRPAGQSAEVFPPRIYQKIGGGFAWKLKPGVEF